MLSPADMLFIGAAALLFFGPDQLPKVARRAGQVVREVQATSQSFIREMERAADEPGEHTLSPTWHAGVPERDLFQADPPAPGRDEAEHHADDTARSTGADGPVQRRAPESTAPKVLKDPPI